MISKLKRRGIVKSLSASICIAALVTGCSQTEQPVYGVLDDPTQPNIIFILVDDLGWNDLGYQGSEIRTPNIDRLAASGLKLTRAYAYPVCSPTRAALMTGQNPIKYGVDGPMENDAQLSAELTLMPEYLKDAGYDTFLVGKWHLGMGDVKAMPHNRGFDHFYGSLGGFIDFYTHVYFGRLDWQRDGQSVREEGFVTHLLTDEATRVISSHDGQSPFFMYLSYTAPHTPLQYPPGDVPTDPEAAMNDRDVFSMMTSDLDDQIGRLSETLANEELADDTLIIFMSDNGGNIYAGADNGSLRGSKGNALEGGVRVPAFLVWPDVIEAGQSYDQPVFVQDWLPTLLHVAGYDTSSSFDGQNVWQELTSGEGNSVPRDPVIVGTAREKAVYDWPYKLVQPENSDGVYTLYDVVADPEEEQDLAAQYPDRVRALSALVQALPKTESKAARGPAPETLFVDTDGDFIYDIRMPETREPWAESAIGADTMATSE